MQVIIDTQLLLTGIPLIDKQHKAYAALVNRLFAMAERGDVDRKTLSLEIDEVLKYAFEHFDAEEYIMQSEKYPHLEEHRIKHNDFREISDALCLPPDSGVDIESHLNTLTKWLIEWFCGQVQIDDQKLAAFLIRKSRAEYETACA
jgi:hemerythrin